MESILDQKIESPSARIVIIGLGMVGLSFIEKILEYDTAKKYTITAICEEPFGKQPSHHAHRHCAKEPRNIVDR